MPDDYYLQRFIEAQNTCYEFVISELTNGKKQSHWMWFIFPQIAGLGQSERAKKYAISSIDEARVYLAQPLLGSRLREVTTIVNQLSGVTALEIFGNIDALKFHSSMTLFYQAGNDDIFLLALKKYFKGQSDIKTLKILQSQSI